MVKIQKENNINQNSPWTRGIIDGLTGAKLLLNSSIESKNRLALILLDSTLEIAFKDYLMYVKGIKNIDKNTLRNREQLHKLVKKHTTFGNEVWESVSYFYLKRCDLYHEDSGKTIMDKGLFDFFNLLILVVDDLFSITSQELILDPEAIFQRKSAKAIKVNDLASTKDVIISALGKGGLVDSRDILETIKRMGYKNSLSASKVSTYLRTYPYIFYFDSKEKLWILTDEGQDIFYSLINNHGGDQNGNR